METKDNGYSVTHAHGTTERFDTYEEAAEAVLAVYGLGAVIGHDGDISDGGERTLCWRDEATAENDDGSRACATIRRKHEI